MNYIETIVDICHANLSAQHRQYMLGRGFSMVSIDDFQMGTFFQEAILDKVPLEVLTEKKIIFKNKNGKYWSEFDQRIIIPIVDHFGECVGITGRVVVDSDRVKYCNSNYTKSSVLFGLDKAKRDILANNTALVVEGNLDVMASFESGFKNTVAVCGTAMSEQHVHLLLRYCDRIVLGFDNDKAGAAARGRSLEMMGYYASHNLLSVSLLEMPDGVKDINELMCTAGKEECRAFLESQMPMSASKPHNAGWEWTLYE
jgi:DNA primase catalytic core